MDGNKFLIASLIEGSYTANAPYIKTNAISITTTKAQPCNLNIFAAIYTATTNATNAIKISNNGSISVKV